MPLTAGMGIARRMLPLLAGTLALLPAPAQARTPVQVEPGRGRAHTVFTISFRAPIDTTIDPFNESYEMAVKGPVHSACARGLALYTSSGHGLRKDQLVRVRVRSPYRHARWSPGTYTGTIFEFSVNPSSTCEQETALPACAAGETLVGAFHFRVTRG
jgi:hypothetical protein